jgi:hypothetical protein
MNKLKTLQQYKTSLRLTNTDLKRAFDLSTPALTSYLNRGAPVSILKKLDEAEKIGLRG